MKKTLEMRLFIVSIYSFNLEGIIKGEINDR